MGGGPDQDGGPWGEPRTRTVRWHDPLVTAGAVPTMSGLDFLSAVRDGHLPPPPIASLLGLRITDV